MIAFTIPVKEKNMIPCKTPNRTACIIFPAANPARSAILFRKKPLNRISSGSAVLKTAYTSTAGIALTPSPENSDVAVLTLLRE